MNGNSNNTTVYDENQIAYGLSVSYQVMDEDKKILYDQEYEELKEKFKFKYGVLRVQSSDPDNMTTYIDPKNASFMPLDTSGSVSLEIELEGRGYLNLYLLPFLSTNTRSL